MTIEIVDDQQPSRALVRLIGGLIVTVVVGLPFLEIFGYYKCRVEVPREYMAIMIKNTRNNLSNNNEIAPDETYKGVQLEVLPEGRFFRNP